MKGCAPSWRIRCLKCGWTQDAGEAGHVRVIGWSWLRYTLSRCGQCRRLRLVAFEKKPGSPPA